ncbi:MAG: tripartite tricarboxylate transporter substrate binding protein [Deltaproteobacteria bacterium]|nr:tripartite tricarboxylate transporter substrate binding protein [Deltaproteobacteria bacterium]
MAACTRRGVLVCLFFFLFGPSPATGQEVFPNRSLQIVVAFPPGGTSDITARILNNKLGELLGQPVVVVNKPGGGGAAGIQSVFTAKPDGYTILTAPVSIVTIPLLTPGAAFTLRDFVPLNIAVSIPNIISVHQNSPFKDLESLIDYARKNPGKLNYSSAGPGSSFHLAGELFKLETKADITHVPMGGEAPALAGLLGGHVDLSFVSLGTVAKHQKAGTLRALAVMYRQRLKDLSGIPTTKERNYPGIISAAWHGYFVHAKTPKSIANKLASALEKALEEKEIVGLIEKAGMLVENLSGQEAAHFLRDEEAKWSRVIKAANIPAK